MYKLFVFFMTSWIFFGFLLVHSQLIHAQTDAPTPLIYVPFDEGSGETTANLGSSGGEGQLRAPAVFDSSFLPSGDFAPPENTSSLNLGDGISTELGSAVRFDLDPTAGLETFTITAWIYPTTTNVGSGGNRIVSTWPLNGPLGIEGRRTGIDFVWGTGDSGEQIQMGINQAPDFPDDLFEGPFSEDLILSDFEWFFVAVTYDDNTDDLQEFPNADMTPATIGEDGILQFFVSSETIEVEFDSEHVYDTGPVKDPTPDGGQLMIGNFTTFVTDDITQQDRQFRGWIDDVRIYDMVLTLEQIREIQTGAVPASIEEWTLF